MISPKHMLTSLRIPLPTMFQEDDYILSLSTQGGTTLEENNVPFTQFPELFTTNTDVLNFSSQMFEDFIDDPEFLQFNSPMLDKLTLFLPSHKNLQTFLSANSTQMLSQKLEPQSLCNKNLSLKTPKPMPKRLHMSTTRKKLLRL